VRVAVPLAELGANATLQFAQRQSRGSDSFSSSWAASASRRLR
jgi:hypothetical protein